MHEENILLVCSVSVEGRKTEERRGEEKEEGRKIEKRKQCHGSNLSEREEEKKENRRKKNIEMKMNEGK